MRRRTERLQRLATAALLLSVACSEAERAGELVISVATDMAMPDQIDNVYLLVQVRGQTIHEDNYPVGSRATNLMPATLTLAAGADPSTPVTVRVSGHKLGEWRTFREATTTVPRHRSALLRMPIQWLCGGQVRTEQFSDGAGGTQTRRLAACDDPEHTCIAGVCQPKLKPNAMLPDYAPEAVFGGASDPARGSCFDTIPCMEHGRVSVPDADCTLEKPDSDQINLALRVASDGICDATKTACFVPLDSGSDEGWTVMPGRERLQITEGACQALRDRRANALYLSDRCPSKRAADPPCGAWSSVPPGANSTPSGPPVVELPKPKEVLQLLEGTTASLCCPLMMDDGKLYTCVCERKPAATLVMIDPNLPQPVRTTVASLNPAESRERLRFGASLYAGALFWQADVDSIRRTPLPGRGASEGSWRANGAVYERSSILASSAGVFMLASGVTDAKGAPVQMLRLEAMTVRSFDTGSTQPVFQFDQDELALYLAVAVDEADGDRTRRTARVVRMDKASGALTTVLEDRVITIADPLRGGGYTGVQVDGSTLFALFEDAPDSAGILTTQVHRVDLATPGRPTTIYETTLDPSVSQLSLIGAVDGAVVFARIEYDRDGSATAVRSASVIVVPGASGDGPAGGSRIVADFARDYPGQDLVSDETQVYWLNSSGRLFSLPRAALR